MATVVMSLRFEFEFVIDAWLELVDVRKALFSRHGDRFRQLARDIDQFAQSPDAPVVHDLGEGIFTSTAGPQLMALLHRAKELGV